MPGKYMLVVDFNISRDFITHAQAEIFHFLVSSGDGDMICQATLAVVINKLICLSQMPF